MNDEYRHDPEDDDNEAVQEWNSLGHGIYLIRITYPDGDAYITWATTNPGGGFTVHLCCPG